MELVSKAQYFYIYDASTVTSLSPQIPGLKPKRLHVGSVLHKAALRQVFLIVLWFSSQWHFSIQSPTMNSNPTHNFKEENKHNLWNEASHSTSAKYEKYFLQHSCIPRSM